MEWLKFVDLNKLTLVISLSADVKPLQMDTKFKIPRDIAANPETIQW